MSSIERNKNAYKIFAEQNCLNQRNSCITSKSKLNQGKESAIDIGSEFENQIKKIFQQKKFFINNQYDQNGVENFLKEKDECLKKIELDDSISYKNLNVHKKGNNEKNQFKNHRNLISVDIKKQTKIENNNQKVIDSFLSNKSGDSIEEILELLK